MDHEGRFDVGHDAGRADRVEVALHELAVPASLRVLTAQDGGDVVTLEGYSEFADMLGDETGQRHGQVEPQSHSTTTVIDELVQLAIGLCPPFALEDLEVLERGVSIGLKP